MKAVCDVITGRLVQENPNGKNIIHAIAGGVNIYTNYTGIYLLVCKFFFNVKKIVKNYAEFFLFKCFHVKSDKILVRFILQI